MELLKLILFLKLKKNRIKQFCESVLSLKLCVCLTTKRKKKAEFSILFNMFKKNIFFLKNVKKKVSFNNYNNIFI